ncbi:MAG: hypothetical protein LBI43_01160 [Streptococcaceae bacterium]|jgi:hypothetical protein|nr:hypothetical protein [Streptococcaceae bacterium]
MNAQLEFLGDTSFACFIRNLEAGWDLFHKSLSTTLDESSKQAKATRFCGSTWRGLRLSEGRLLVRSAPYSDASRVIKADSPTRSGGDRHALKYENLTYLSDFKIG